MSKKKKLHIKTNLSCHNGKISVDSDTGKAYCTSVFSAVAHRSGSAPNMKALSSAESGRIATSTGQVGAGMGMQTHTMPTHPQGGCLVASPQSDFCTG